MNIIKRYICCCFVKRWFDAGSIVITKHDITKHDISTLDITKHDVSKYDVSKMNVNVMIDDGRISELSRGSL
jgi:hypothetical protein